eukprot:c22384_g1_i2 orf=239-1009(+)
MILHSLSSSIYKLPSLTGGNLGCLAVIRGVRAGATLFCNSNGFALSDPPNSLAHSLPRHSSADSSASMCLCEGHVTLAGSTRMEMEVKRSKFVAWAAPVDSENAALGFLAQVRDPKATHNCWAYKIGNLYRFNDDGEPGGTAGRPIYSSIVASGLDRVIVVVTRFYGGVKLGTGGLFRAYGGVALDCLKEATTVLVKAKLHSHQVEKLQEDYDSAEGGGAFMRLLVEHDKAHLFELAVKDCCSGKAKITWPLQHSM